MDRFLPVLLFLLLSAVASHAALPAQVYWQTVLPNTPMPSAIRDLLRPDTIVDEKTGTTVSFRKGGINVNTGKGKPSDTTVDVGHKGVGVNVHKGQGGTHVGVGGGGVNVKTDQRTTAAYSYRYAVLFFLEKDLHPGAKMTLRFTSTTPGAAFLPRRVADSIPFSSKKLPEILDQFSVEPNSVEAEDIKTTLQDCELPAEDGERKYCATSLESMVDFSTSSLGTRDVRAISTTVGREGARQQQYTVAPSGVRRMPGSQLVGCHAEAYPYAVFYCHTTRSTRLYTVEMVGANGAAVEAVAVCHTDTAGWNPEHPAFQVLKVKPGTVPVCHFLPQDNIVWTPSK